jgi:predicted transcriptional regulator
MSDESNPVTALTARIVGAFASANAVAHTEVPKLIHAVHAALEHAVKPVAEALAKPEKPTASQIRKSITPDALISFIDGKPYKTLKRHLTRHGLTVETYKEKFGLPKHYPTTAPNYSAARSAMARAVGLGRKAAVVAPKASPRRGRVKTARTKPS